MPDRSDDYACLRLHEQVLLVALHDEKGSMQATTTCGYALGGAILAELLLLGRVRIEGEGRKARIVTTDTGTGTGTPTGDALLDECLGEVAEARRPKDAANWVSRFATRRGLRDRIAEALVELGAIRREEGRVLIIFPVTRYPESDPGYEAEVNRRLADAVFGDDPVEDPRTVTLLALLHGASMLPLVFDRGQLKGRKARIESVINGDASGSAVRSAIEAMQAVLVATTAATTAAVTASVAASS